MSKINNANSDKFNIVFSDIPVPQDRTTPLSIEPFNNYVKSVTLPDYSIEMDQSNFQGSVNRYPVSKFNADLSQLTIDFFVDEDLETIRHSLIGC